MTAQELISQSPSITIDVLKNGPLSDLERAFSLFFALKKLGKDVSLTGNITQLELITSPVQFTKEKTVAVTLKGLGQVVSKIFYERDQKDLRLYFSFQKGEFSTKDLAIDISPAPRLTLIVGENRPEHNLTQATLLTKDIANSVLSMLKERERNQTRLLAYVLARAEHKKEHSLCFSHVDDAGFQKTQTSPKQLAPIIEELRTHGRASLSYFLLFEERSAVRGLLWSKNNNLKELFCSLGQRQERGPWTLLTFPQKNTKELKKQITALL